MELSKVDPNQAHGDVPGINTYHVGIQDAPPDEVEGSVDSDGMSNTTPNASIAVQNEDLAPTSTDELQNFEPTDSKNNPAQSENTSLGDDFDEFEEGDAEDDFGDFDDGFQQASDEVNPASEQQNQTPQPMKFTGLSLPPMDFDKCNNVEDVVKAADPYLKLVFPEGFTHGTPVLEPLPSDNSVFLTERSLSLWSQLIAPPPLQPPNWVRSRVRRLFLVSLGVPVDLDEILPASKQKKLVLPSINLSDSRSPRPSTEDRLNGSVTRLRQENGSSGSVNSSASGSASRRRRGPPPPPDFDLSMAKMMGETTDIALTNLTDEELQMHLDRLKEAQQRASEVLEYWLKRKDGAMGDKEAFEGVIENLVKHARRVRK